MLDKDSQSIQGSVDNMTDDDIVKMVRSMAKNPFKKEHSGKTVNVPDGVKVVFEADISTDDDPYKDSLSPFTPIGSLRMKQSKPVAKEDIFDLLKQVNKSAYDLFVLLKLHTARKNNLCYYPINKFSKLETSAFNKKLSQLKKVGIFKRAKTIDKREPIKSGTFMLNPYLIKPPKDLGKYKQMWDLL